MKFYKPSLMLTVVLTVAMLGLTEANNSTPRLAPVRLCGRDFIRTVVRVCPDQGRRRRSLEEFEIPKSETTQEEGKTGGKTKGLADVLGVRKWREAHSLTKRNVRLAERCCHQGCTIAEIAESVCF